MSNHSTRKPRSRKPTNRPKKPYPDFPLTPHGSGKWMKKIRGKIHYFGKWMRRVKGMEVRVDGDGWEAALATYMAQTGDLHAGRTPRAKPDGLTVKELCNRFLTAKQRKMDAHEIGSRMFGEIANLWESACGVAWIDRVAARLAESVEHHEPLAAVPMNVPLSVLRNGLFACIVLTHGVRRLLTHGVRRLLPPYG